MIFGIKTKKDKKIEELQKEIDKLKFQPLKSIGLPVSVSTIGASYVLDKLDTAIVPESYIRAVLANMLAKELIRARLPIEKIKMDNGDVDYKVKLKVILNDLYRN